jgi:hypothetical protein
MMSKINMTEQLILECGYQEYKPSPLEHEGITKCWQKRFDDDVGKKYFINIHRWDLPPHPYTHELTPTSYEFECQLNKNDKPINLNMFNGWSIQEAEEWVEDVWSKCGCDYYEKWWYE